MRPLVLTLTACAPAAEVCVSLREGNPFANHLMPFDVAVDASHRVAWSTALATPTLAGIDLDSGEQVAAITYLDTPGVYPTVAVDESGHAWVGAQSDPGLVYIDTSTGHANEVPGYTDVHAVLALPAGGIVVLGKYQDNAGVARLDAGGKQTAWAEAEGAGGLLLRGGQVGVFGSGTTLALLDSDSLDELDRCPMPFPATHGAAVSGGIVVAAETRVGFTDCGENAWAQLVGNENKAVVPQDDGAWVLDRVGSPDPNLGLARFVDASGLGPSFPTAKNSGLGGFDAVTRRLWVNSEGTAEVVALDPATGSVVRAVRTGEFVDGVAIGRDPSTILATGRLSDAVARIEGTKVVALSRAVSWPYSPTLDRLSGRLWVLSQTHGEAVALDAETLQTVARFPLAAKPNPLLTFGTLTYVPGDGRVFVAESNADRLFAIDPSVGVTNVWDLGGPAVGDPDTIGELRVRQDGVTGALLVTPTTDGRVQRLDLATGTLTTTWLAAAEVDALRSRRRVDAMRILPEDDELWLGGFALAAGTLKRLDGRDLPAATVLARYPSPRLERIALAPDADAVERVDERGNVLRRVALETPLPSGSVVRMARGELAAVVGRATEARVCRVELDGLQ